MLPHVGSAEPSHRYPFQHTRSEEPVSECLVYCSLLAKQTAISFEKNLVCERPLVTQERCARSPGCLVDSTPTTQIPHNGAPTEDICEGTSEIDGLLRLVDGLLRCGLRPVTAMIDD